MQIGDRIKARREALGDFSQEKLAKILGYSGRSTINKIELNKSKVSQDMVEKFATALNTSPAYLMGWTDDPELTHEQTLELERQGRLKPHIIAADTSNIDGKPTIIAQSPDFVHYGNIYPIELKKFPLLGAVACGEPIYSPEDTDVYVMANADIKADFVLKARGDSMINARIYDGDIVFIKAQPVVELGEVAAVAIDNEVTLKRTYYYPNKGKLILNPENPAYEPMVFIGSELNSIRILGKAVAFQSTVK